MDVAHTFTFVTYNIGQLFDYQNLVVRNQPMSLDSVVNENFAKIRKVYEAAEEKYTKDEHAKWWDHPKFKAPEENLPPIQPIRKERLGKDLEFFAKQCDVLFLQEVVDDLNLVKEKLGENFDIHCNLVKESWRPNPTADAAICWDKRKFTKLEVEKENEILTDINAKDRSRVAVVRIQHMATKEIFCLASIHAPGFSITAPTPGSVKSGDDAVKLATKLLNANQADFQMVAGDLNTEASPSYYTNEQALLLAQQRLQELVQTLVRVPFDQPTAYNSDVPGNRAQLDHVFVKDKTASYQVSVSNRFGYELENVLSHASDHLPLAIDMMKKA